MVSISDILPVLSLVLAAFGVAYFVGMYAGIIDLSNIAFLLFIGSGILWVILYLINRVRHRRK